LATSGWESLALFQAGVDWQLDGDSDRARAIYVRALDEDPENRGALLNLGVIEAPGDPGLAAGRLEKIVQSIDTGRPGRSDGGAESQPPWDRQDLLWIRATYSLAALYANLAACLDYQGACKEKCEHKLDGDLKEARQGRDKYARLLYDRCAHLLVTEGTDPHVRELAAVALPRAQPLLQRSDQAGPSLADAPAEWPFPVSPGARVTSSARYGLACYYADGIRQSQREGTGSREAATQAKEERDKLARLALFHLGLAFESGRRSWVDFAPKDPALCPLRIAYRKEWDELLARHGKTVSKTLTGRLPRSRTRGSFT